MLYRDTDAKGCIFRRKVIIEGHRALHRKQTLMERMDRRLLRWVHGSDTIWLIEERRGGTQSSQKRSSEPGDDDTGNVSCSHSTATVFKVVHCHSCEGVDPCLDIDIISGRLMVRCARRLE